jgi:ABC-type hemin transport system ATPase subunit
MTGEFPLSQKQRNALHYFLQQKDGEILDVNGPPGTGKTTLLRSVVADMWANAALDEKEPPLIVATSNNNQAVTNILESFAKVDEEGLQEELKVRWLP